jgi:membrane associated rhomboid family serine protease
MNNQNVGQGNNDRIRFNNPYNLDPAKEDIAIEKKMNKDIFCPLVAMSSDFGLENDYYSMRTVNPLKESFFHTMEALIFPNATPFQFSSIICYIITIVYIALLFFGLDSTNTDQFLPIKISTADTIGSFFPLKIKNNPIEYYRLITFHFIHFNFSHYLFNVLSLISFCSLFELLIKEYKFILIFFLTGITSNLTAISLFGEYERYCGINADVSGILGAFIMFFIINWSELIPMLGQIGRFLTAYLVCVYLFMSFVFYHLSEYGNFFVQIISLTYGGLLFSIFIKPIKVVRWKIILRVISIIMIISFILISMIKFYLK